MDIGSHGDIGNICIRDFAPSTGSLTQIQLPPLCAHFFNKPVSSPNPKPNVFGLTQQLKPTYQFGHVSQNEYLLSRCR